MNVARLAVSLVALLPFGPLLAADAPPERCSAFEVAGIGLGMSSEQVRVSLGRLGTPVASADRPLGSTLSFELAGAVVEVDLDRRPRRRRPGRVVAVRERRTAAIGDPATLVAEFERRLGAADDGSAVSGSGPIRARWSDAACDASVELAIGGQANWWQPVADGVVVTLARLPAR